MLQNPKKLNFFYSRKKFMKKNARDSFTYMHTHTHTRLHLEILYAEQQGAKLIEHFWRMLQNNKKNFFYQKQLKQQQYKLRRKVSKKNAKFEKMNKRSCVIFLTGCFRMLVKCKHCKNRCFTITEIGNKISQEDIQNHSNPDIKR